MNCPSCQEHFTDLLEAADGGSSDAGGPSAAREHLENCQSCATAFADFRDTVRQLRGLPVVPPPPGLLGQIARALDNTSVAPAPGTALWQPVTAGFAVAACLVLVLWSVVLIPVSSGFDAISSQVTYNPPTSSAGPTVAPAPNPATPSAPVVGGPGRPMAHRPAGAWGRMVRPMRPGGDRGAMQPPDLGSWGSKLAKLPPSGEGTTSPPAGIDPATGKSRNTFGPSDSLTPDRPLHRQSGDIQLAFAPPAEKPVGTAVVGELTITSQAEAMITLRVRPEPGIRVTNARRGVLYQGAIRKGETRQVVVRLQAAGAGTHRLRVSLESDVAGVAADLEVIIPGFVGEAGKNQGAPVSLRFHETPSLQAIRELAAAAGARVVVHEDVETKSVTLDFSAGVPFAAALRVLCDECGYRIEDRNGVYHIVRLSETTR